MFNNYIKMYKDNSLLKLRSKLVCTFFGIYTFLMFFSIVYAGSLGDVFSMLPKIASLVLIVGVIESVALRKPDSSYIIYGVLILLGFIIKHISGLSFPLWFFLILLMISEVNFNKIVKVFFVITGILTVFTVFLSVLKLFPTFASLRMSSSGVIIKRQALGFDWVTDGSQIFLYLLLCFVFLKKGKLNFKELIVILLSSMFFYFETNTRNPFILEVILIFILALMNTKIGTRLSKIIKGRFVGILAIIIFPICFCLSLITAVLGISGPITAKLNILLSNRVWLSYMGLQRYGIHLLGSHVKYNNSLHGVTKGVYFYLDSSYIQYLINFGLIFSLIIIVLLTLTMILEYKKKNWYVSLIFIIIAIHSLQDPQLIYLQFSPFALIVIEVIDRFKLKIR